MTNRELEREVSKQKTYIRELRTLIKDVLRYDHVVQCRDCKNYRKKESHCSHWNREVFDYGYCNYGVRK